MSIPNYSHTNIIQINIRTWKSQLISRVPEHEDYLLPFHHQARKKRHVYINSYTVHVCFPSMSLAPQRASQMLALPSIARHRGVGGGVGGVGWGVTLVDQEEQK